MKKLPYTILLSIFILACSSPPNFEKAIIDYLEIEDGIKTDLKIQFKTLEVSDITVADSITIIQSQFNVAKAKKIEIAEKSVQRLQDAINKQKGKNTSVSKALVSGWNKDLAKVELELKEAHSWTHEMLKKYDSHKPTDIIAKKVISTFSFFNPKLQTTQEITALFILSADGTKCHNMIKQ